MRWIGALLASNLCLASAGAIDARATADPSAGAHGFDFEFGTWRVHHRVKRADGSGWTEFDGTCTDRALADGSANVEEHRFDKPGGVTWGVAMRAFDAKSATWAIWWIDGRDPHGALDPPVKGRFEHGVGTFVSDGVVDGKPVRTRFVWSDITRDTARWEQAYSYDAGSTWDTNWTMDFRRIP
ncbi:MAG: hypothetical protein ABW186_00720 [Rhodanobacteraceae bacterium]